MDKLTIYAKKGKINEAMQQFYPQLEKISIDYSLMEKAQNILLLVAPFNWNDIGSWTALEKYFSQDKENNTSIGDVQYIDASNNLVYSKNHLTALIGVENLMVLQADGVTLVCSKDQAQDIKSLLTQLRKTDQYKHLL